MYVRLRGARAEHQLVESAARELISPPHSLSVQQKCRQVTDNLQMPYGQMARCLTDRMVWCDGWISASISRVLLFVRKTSTTTAIPAMSYGLFFSTDRQIPASHSRIVDDSSERTPCRHFCDVLRTFDDVLWTVFDALRAEPRCLADETAMACGHFRRVSRGLFLRRQGSTAGWWHQALSRVRCVCFLLFNKTSTHPLRRTRASRLGETPRLWQAECRCPPTLFRTGL